MRIDDSNSEEEDVPLPQPGDMHMEFKKSSLPKRVNQSKSQLDFSELQPYIQALVGNGR